MSNYLVEKLKEKLKKEFARIKQECSIKGVSLLECFNQLSEFSLTYSKTIVHEIYESKFREIAAENLLILPDKLYKYMYDLATSCLPEYRREFSNINVGSMFRTTDGEITCNHLDAFESRVNQTIVEECKSLVRKYQIYLNNRAQQEKLVKNSTSRKRATWVGAAIGSIIAISGNIDKILEFSRTVMDKFFSLYSVLRSWFNHR